MLLDFPGGKVIPLPLKRRPALSVLSHLRLSVSPARGCLLCASHAGAQLSSLVLRAGDAIGGHDCRFLSVWSVSPIVGWVSHRGGLGGRADQPRSGSKARSARVSPFPTPFPLL